MNREQLWFWITNIRGIGNVKIKNLLNYYEKPSNIWYAANKELKTIKKLREDDINNLIASRNEERIIELYNKIKNNMINFYSIEHDKYPKKLKNIYDPPYGIYVKGILTEDSIPKIAIVGAREASEYGKWVAEYFGRELSNAGVLVISGMARGIDSYAHKGALKSGNNTYAVLGCGINICYPKENFKLMADITKQGAIISELPINATPIPGNFPLRNRIISGLSDGVLIVEAAKKSGSLITANLALDQGREVYVVPGRITDKLSVGTNELIKIGAKTVTKMEDITEDLFIKYKDEKQKKTENISESLAKNEKIVYSCLSLDPLYIDVLLRMTKLPIDELQYLLVKLEFKGAIKQLPNKYFIRKL